MGETNPPQAERLEEGLKKEEALFFNVMPKNMGTNKTMVMPKISTTETASGVPEAGRASLLDVLKKYKLYAGLTAAILILTPAAYFITLKFLNDKPRENLLPTQQPEKNQRQNEPEPRETLNFATQKEWRDKYFPGCEDDKTCGDSADPDRDGLANIEEENMDADPNNNDSDRDGLADGDEVNVFGSSPSNNRTAGDPKYTDADYIKGGYNFSDDSLMTKEQISEVTSKMKTHGLRPVTIETLGEILNSFYGFSMPEVPQNFPDQASSTPPSNEPLEGMTAFDQSLGAKQDRDTQRSGTTKNIGVALIKYKRDNGSYPLGADFTAMHNTVRPYLVLATNPADPINKYPYVYTYAANASGTDFTLSFFSEIASQQIKKTSADAEKDSQNGQAAVYDNQRQTDLESLRLALLLYSQKNIAGSQEYVFPPKDKYKTALAPEFISSIPKDPVTGQDYDYQPSATFDAFTLKAILQNPPPGNTGYLCNQVDDCHTY